MFIGHYAVAFALKGKENKASLGGLFLATQFVDILFFPFALLGLEKLEFVPGYTEVNDFLMEFPLTHGLLGSVIWSLLYAFGFYAIWGRKKPYGKNVAVIMGIGVLSHWFADVLVHTPDLPLIQGDPKFGFGLWHYKSATMLLEMVLLVSAFIYYVKKTSGKLLIPLMFLVFLMGVNYVNYYVLPTDNDLGSLTTSALAAYFILALMAQGVNRKRD